MSLAIHSLRSPVRPFARRSTSQRATNHDGVVKATPIHHSSTCSPVGDTSTPRPSTPWEAAAARDGRNLRPGHIRAGTMLRSRCSPKQLTSSLAAARRRRWGRAPAIDNPALQPGSE